MWEGASAGNREPPEISTGGMGHRIWVEDRRGEILGGREGEREGDMVSSGTGPQPDAGRPRGARALQQEAKGPGWKKERH